MSSEPQQERKKSLGLFAMVMMLACGLLNTDLISSNTAAGLPIVSWWMIIGIFYMIPTGLIMTELTLAYPKNGGLYYWISEGLGPRWGSRCSWLYWACGLFLPPASYLMVSDIVCTTFFPQVSYAARAFIAIAVLWVGTWVSTLPMKESSKIFNCLGIINILVYVGVFVAGSIFVYQGNPVANNFTVEALTPKLNEAVIYVPVALFCASGMEICSQSIEDSINPKRDMLRSMFVITILCVGLNIIASVGILMIQPLDNMSIMSGISDIFITAWNNRFLYIATNIAIILGIISQVTSWAIAGSRTVCEAAKEKQFPAIFGKETKAGLPLSAILINSSISTVVLLIYAFIADKASDAFYSLMGCSVIASMVPYIVLVVAYNKLRKTKLKDHTGWKVPCGRLVSYVLQFMQVFVTILLIWVPGQGITESAGLILAGSGAIFILGEIIIRRQERIRNSQRVERGVA